MSFSTPDAEVGTALERAVDATTSSYAIKLAVFEGPLDLLLHLIRQNEVEITDIPIAEISAQYLEFLDLMRELNLELAGEYLVMAATLAWIKSRMLLPPDKEADEGEEIDPRAELVARLLEYQRFKEAALRIGDRNLLGRDVFDARLLDSGRVSESDREVEVGLFELVRAFQEALRRAGPKPKMHEIEAESVRVHDQMRIVMEQLETVRSIELGELLARTAGPHPSRAVIVATFLAILELTRLAALRIYQSLNAAAVPMGPIHLRRAIEPGDRTWERLVAEVT